MVDNINTKNFIYGPPDEVKHLYNVFKTLSNSASDNRNDDYIYNIKKSFKKFNTGLCEYEIDGKPAGYCFGFITETPFTPNPVPFKNIIILEAPQCKICFDTINNYEAVRYNPDNLFFSEYKYVAFPTLGAAGHNNTILLKDDASLIDYLNSNSYIKEIGVSLEHKIRIADQIGFCQVWEYDEWNPMDREKEPKVINLIKDTKSREFWPELFPYIDDAIFEVAEQTNRELLFIPSTHELRLYCRDEAPGCQLEGKFDCLDMESVKEVYSHFAKVLSKLLDAHTPRIQQDTSIKDLAKDFLKDLKLNYLNQMVEANKSFNPIFYNGQSASVCVVFNEHQIPSMVSVNKQLLGEIQSVYIKHEFDPSKENADIVNIMTEVDGTARPVISSVSSDKNGHSNEILNLIKNIENQKKEVFIETSEEFTM